MFNLNAPKKILMILVLGIMILSWIIHYPITVIASDKCKNCKEICQCAKSIDTQKNNTKNPTCDSFSSCLGKSSPEIPLNIKHTSNLIDNQMKNDGIIPTNAIIRYDAFAYYMEYKFLSPKTPLYVKNSQYRSPPSL